MVGVGGFIPSSLLPKDEPRGRMTITFGAQGFFGYGACTIASQSNHFAMCTAPMGDQAVWWSTYETSHPPDTRNFDKQDIIRQLQKRHAGWKDPVIQEIVADAAIDSVYPTWITPELPTWHAHGIVIVGDAAHAMQPSSGQGTSQALEDVQVLSMLLAHYLERHFSQSADRVGRQVPATVDEAVDQASEKYFELRRPRVKRIVDRAKQMGDTKRKKGIFEEYLTYSILWVIGKFTFPPPRSCCRANCVLVLQKAEHWPSGKLPIDSYTKQLYNDLPVNQVKKFIEEDKLHPVPLYETTHILWD